jgi:hypothetical protein
MYGVTNARIKLKTMVTPTDGGIIPKQKGSKRGSIKVGQSGSSKSPGQVVIDTTFLQLGTLFASRILHSPGTRHGIYVCVYLVVAVAAAAAALAHLTYNIAVRGGRK